jgi:hypothetical protein
MAAAIRAGARAGELGGAGCRYNYANLYDDLQTVKPGEMLSETYIIIYFNILS